MNAEAIRELLRHQPFEPFEVHMTSGEVHLIRHPEQAFLAGTRLLIYFPETDRLAWGSLLHIANLLMQHPAA
jgi:hypothetical protein